MSGRAGPKSSSTDVINPGSDYGLGTLRQRRPSGIGAGWGRIRDPGQPGVTDLGSAVSGSLPSLPCPRRLPTALATGAPRVCSAPSTPRPLSGPMPVLCWGSGAPPAACPVAPGFRFPVSVVCSFHADRNRSRGPLVPRAWLFLPLESVSSGAPGWAAFPSWMLAMGGLLFPLAWTS